MWDDCIFGVNLCTSVIFFCRNLHLRTSANCDSLVPRLANRETLQLLQQHLSQIPHIYIWYITLLQEEIVRNCYGVLQKIPTVNVPAWWGVVSQRWLSELSAISIMSHRPYKPALEPGGHLGLYSHQPLKLFVVGPKAVVENSCRCGDLTSFMFVWNESSFTQVPLLQNLTFTSLLILFLFSLFRYNRSKFIFIMVTCTIGLGDMTWFQQNIIISK